MSENVNLLTARVTNSLEDLLAVHYDLSCEFLLLARTVDRKFFSQAESQLQKGDSLQNIEYKFKCWILQLQLYSIQSQKSAFKQLIKEALVASESFPEWNIRFIVKKLEAYGGWSDWESYILQSKESVKFAMDRKRFSQASLLLLLRIQTSFSHERISAGPSFEEFDAVYPSLPNSPESRYLEKGRKLLGIVYLLHRGKAKEVNDLVVGLAATFKLELGSDDLDEVTLTDGFHDLDFLTWVIPRIIWSLVSGLANKSKDQEKAINFFKEGLSSITCELLKFEPVDSIDTMDEKSRIHLESLIRIKTYIDIQMTEIHTTRSEYLQANLTQTHILLTSHPALFKEFEHQIIFCWATVFERLSRTEMAVEIYRRLTVEGIGMIKWNSSINLFVLTTELENQDDLLRRMIEEHSSDNKVQELVISVVQGKVALSLGQFQAAKLHLLNGLKLASETQDAYFSSLCLSSLGYLFENTNKPQSLSMYKKCLLFAKKIRSLPLEIEALKALSRLGGGDEVALQKATMSLAKQKNAALEFIDSILL